MTEAAHEGTERASSAALVGVEGVTHSSLKSGVSDAGIKIEDLPLPKYTRRFSPGSSSPLGALGWLDHNVQPQKRVRPPPASALGLSRLPLTGACGGGGHCGRVPERRCEGGGGGKARQGGGGGGGEGRRGEIVADWREL